MTSTKDDIKHVVDYAHVEAKVRSLVTRGHTRMAETLARRITETCLTDERVISVRVRVEKLEALPEAESAGAEIERSRSA
jgi:dihydroneopterin aldolase